MPHCQSCEGFVSHDFARVFGNNADTVAACAHCAPIGEYTRAEPEYPAHETITTIQR